MDNTNHYAMAYAAPMPKEELADIYKRKFDALQNAIQNLKGLTKEVKELKEFSENLL